MATVEDFDEAVERCQLALGEFVKGDPIHRLLPAEPPRR